MMYISVKMIVFSSCVSATPAITVQVVKKGLVPLIVHLLPDAFDIKKEASQL